VTGASSRMRRCIGQYDTLRRRAHALARIAADTG
jgi:hypothetical protein